MDIKKPALRPVFLFLGEGLTGSINNEQGRRPWLDVYAMLAPVFFILFFYGSHYTGQSLNDSKTLPVQFCYISQFLKSKSGRVQQD